MNDVDPAERTTPVDGQVIHEVARQNGMGAGALKAALEGLERGEDLEDLRSSLEGAARQALRAHGREAVKETRDAWQGEAAYSEELDRIVTVTTVYDPHADDVLDDLQPVEVELGDDHQHVTSLDTLTAVEGVSLDVDADAGEARELLDVLTAGIEAVEDDGDESAEYARRVRKAIRDGHKRLDNSLTTRRAGR